MNKISYSIKSCWYRYIRNDTDALIATRVAWLRQKGMRIGKNCRITGKLNVFEPYLVTIGNEVTFSTNVSLITHDNSVIKVLHEATDVFGEVTIGNNCFIGLGAIILPGVQLEDNVIVAAGSVVTKSVRSGSVVAGNPARVVETWENLKNNISTIALDMRENDNDERRAFLLSHKDSLIHKRWMDE